MSYQIGYNRVMASAGLEKNAFFGSVAKGAWGAAKGGAKKLKDSFGAVKNMGEEAGKYQKAQTAAAGEASHFVGRDMRRAATQGVADYGKKLAPAAAVTAAGVGAAGVGAVGAGAYAAGPADTRSNNMKNMSNNYLGTNFKQQSRAGNFFS